MEYNYPVPCPLMGNQKLIWAFALTYTWLYVEKPRSGRLQKKSINMRIMWKFARIARITEKINTKENSTIINERERGNHDESTVYRRKLRGS